MEQIRKGKVPLDRHLEVFSPQVTLPCGNGKGKPWVMVTPSEDTVLLSAPHPVKVEWGAARSGLVTALLFPKRENHIDFESASHRTSHFLSTSHRKISRGLREGTVHLNT